MKQSKKISTEILEDIKKRDEYLKKLKEIRDERKKEK